jgi:predicted esterase
MAHESNKQTPTLICHGTDDQVVPFECGITMKQQLEKWGRLVDFKAYPGVGHGACQDELKDVKEFLESRLLQ